MSQQGLPFEVLIEDDGPKRGDVPGSGYRRMRGQVRKNRKGHQKKPWSPFRSLVLNRNKATEKGNLVLRNRPRRELILDNFTEFETMKVLEETGYVIVPQSLNQPSRKLEFEIIYLDYEALPQMDTVHAKTINGPIRERQYINAASPKTTSPRPSIQTIQANKKMSLAS